MESSIDARRRQWMNGKHYENEASGGVSFESRWPRIDRKQRIDGYTTRGRATLKGGGQQQINHYPINKENRNGNTKAEETVLIDIRSLRKEIEKDENKGSIMNTYEYE